MTVMGIVFIKSRKATEDTEEHRGTQRNTEDFSILIS